MAEEPPASPAGSPPEQPQQLEQESLLSLQTTKAELIQQRDALLAKKNDLHSAIERLQSSWDSYQAQSKQYDTKKKLEYYLRQNDQEYEKRLAGEDEVASFVLENMHVLPSSNWGRRMDVVGILYPHMRIHNALLKNVHDTDNKLVTQITFTLLAKGLPSLNVELTVWDEKVIKLDILQSKKATIVLHKTSPTFANILTEMYVKDCKVDLIVYGYHSLASMQAKRVSIFLSLLRQFSGNRIRPGAMWENDPFDSLRAIPYIEFEFVHSKTAEPYIVRLYWHLALRNHFLARIDSELDFAVIRKSDQSVLGGASTAFLNLVAEYGVCKSFELMVSNLFT